MLGKLQYAGILDRKEEGIKKNLGCNAGVSFFHSVLTPMFVNLDAIRKIYC